MEHTDRLHPAPRGVTEAVRDQHGRGEQLARAARPALTCMPQTLTPSVADVLCSHFLICRAAFSADASSPCCRVPIFRSSTQGHLKWCTTFSSSRNSGPRSRRTTATLYGGAVSPDAACRHLTALKCGFHPASSFFLLKIFIVLKYKHTTCRRYFEERGSTASSTSTPSWNRLPALLQDLLTFPGKT